jgi:predicted transcriptional regulator
LENGLIEYEEGRQTYRTTEKGIRLLQIYNHMSDELVISNNIR